LAEALRAAGVDVVETREPTRSAAGERLREIFSRAERTSTAEEELELFEADRREHVATLVEPALKRGAWVVQDRTFWSTAAYQGARGLDPDEIVRRSLVFARKPDLTLLLLLSPEEALARIARSRARPTSFERRDDLAQVDRVYRRLAAREPTIVSIEA